MPWVLPTLLFIMLFKDLLGPTLYSYSHKVFYSAHSLPPLHYPSSFVKQTLSHKKQTTINIKIAFSPYFFTKDTHCALGYTAPFGE